MLDNYATHKHAKVRQWLAARPRFHLHFTPTYSSWLNQVERWFGLLSQRAIKRGSFRSVADLVRKIQAFIDRHNTSATPFVWVATAQSIIDKVARIAIRISGTATSGDRHFTQQLIDLLSADRAPSRWRDCSGFRLRVLVLKDRRHARRRKTRGSTVFSTERRDTGR